MIAAASAWDALAAELAITAAGYGSVLSELIDRGWLGPASQMMANAAAPYVTWLHSTAAQAEQTALQAKAAAVAYELAFAMTVPPPVIAANRSLLLVLVATNFFGQNTAAIAATEAHYAEMWLQDAAAMYGYAGSSAAASQLTPFTEPHHASDPTGLAAQHGALASAPTVSNPSLFDYLLRVPNITNTTLSTSNAVTSGRGIFIQNARLAFQEAQPEPPPQTGAGLVSAGAAGLRSSVAPGPVAAGVGRASLIGKLSVPPSWLTAAPEIRPAALMLPHSAASTVSTASADIPPAPGSVFSQSVLGTLSRHDASTQQHKSKPIIVRTPATG